MSPLCGMCGQSAASHAPGCPHVVEFATGTERNAYIRGWQARLAVETDPVRLAAVKLETMSDATLAGAKALETEDMIHAIRVSAAVLEAAVPVLFAHNSAEGGA